MTLSIITGRPRLRRWLERHFAPWDQGLALACGADHIPGWVHADLYCPRAERKVDLQSFPWPIQDGEFSRIIVDQYLEHIPQKLDGEDGLMRTLREIARILSVGGRVLIGVPHWRHDTQWSHPMHYRAFAPQSFSWFGSGSEVEAEAGRIPLRLVSVAKGRRLQLFGLDSSYHLPKHLKWGANIGVVEALWFVLERV